MTELKLGKRAHNKHYFWISQNKEDLYPLGADPKAHCRSYDQGVKVKKFVISTLSGIQSSVAQCSNVLRRINKTYNFQIFEYIFLF